MSSPKLKVLYIAGESRSGSTILGKILGESKDVFFTGEILNIWQHFLLDNKICACGLPATECAVWTNIFKTAYKKTLFDPREMESWRRNNIRNRSAWKMLLPQASNKLRTNLSDYLKNLERLYYAISKTTNTSVIVDSSKRPTYGFLVSLIPTIDLYVLHLVRDARGVAHSWKKKKVQQKVNGKSIYMRQFLPVTSAWRWNISNLLTELLLKSSPKYIRIRYEDFVHTPTKELSKIFRLMNLSEQNLPIVNQDEVRLSTNHSVWGNPSRFQTGKVKLQGDNEWREKLPPQTRKMITLLTWFGLKRYQYRLF